MFDTDDIAEAKRMLPIYKRAVDVLETVSGKKTEQAEQDLDTCPGCGGVADNGHDREFPPNPYYCTKCIEQAEPVAWMHKDGCVCSAYDKENMFGHEYFNIPLYTNPVRTKDLTDYEIVSVLEYYDHEWDETTFAIARAVIAADREKNRA